VEALFGVGIVLLGVPFYFYFQKVHKAKSVSAELQE
jgi:hypothetical protein